MKPTRLPSATVVGLVAVTALAIGAGAVLLLVPPDQPSALRPPTPAEAVPVETRDDVDERQVQLVLQTGSPREIVSPRAGVLTGSSCSTGGDISSGDVVATVDGNPVIALATAVPLWRGLDLDDRGDDVRGLQAELARLGVPVTVDGAFGVDTRRAVRSFLTAKGVAMSAIDAVPVEAVTWLPAPRVRAEGCEGVVGSPVDMGDELIRLPVELQAARLEKLPLDASPGDRVVTVAGVTTPVSAEGAVTDPTDLARLASTPDYASVVDDDAPAVTARWSLAEPVRVTVVPPSSLVDVRDGSACLQPVDDSGQPRQPLLVDVVGSQLGQSYVVPHGGTPVTSVVPRPDGSLTCR